MIICMLVMAVIAFLFLAVYLFIDFYVTRERIKRNQTEWDSFSAGMTEMEKLNVYNDWCDKQKLKNDWNFYYFPKF